MSLIHLPPCYLDHLSKRRFLLVAISYRRADLTCRRQPAGDR